MNKRYFKVCVLVLLTVVVTAGVTPLLAQRFVDVPAGYGTLQAVLSADSANRVTNPNTVYRLHRGVDSTYILVSPLAAWGSMPLQIQSTGSGPLPHLMIATLGDGTPFTSVITVKANLSLKGVYIDGVNTLGVTQDRIIRIQSDSLKVRLDSVQFNMSTQSFIRVENKTSLLYLKNCRVSNVYSDWANGRGIDNRGVTIDTLWEANNTWFRLGQRSYRDGGGIIKYAYFNHNTFADIGDASVSLGATKSVVFKNNLISNVGFTGLNTTTSSRMLTLTPVPEGQTVFVTHNVFNIDTVAWRAAFHATGHDSLLIPMMFSDTINTQIAAQGLTSTNIFSPVTFTRAPGTTPGAASVDSILRWYWKDPVAAGTNASILKVDSIRLVNFAYSTSSPAYTFGDDGKPAGSTEWFGIVLSAPQHSTGQVPAAFALGQNYPNPFNPSTHISYSIGKAAQVRLEIFNLLGQSVRIVTNAHLQAGPYTVEWDGRDAAGRILPTGVYLYRLQADGVSLTKSMILMK